MVYLGLMSPGRHKIRGHLLQIITPLEGRKGHHNTYHAVRRRKERFGSDIGTKRSYIFPDRVRPGRILWKMRQASSLWGCQDGALASLKTGWGVWNTCENAFGSSMHGLFFSSVLVSRHLIIINFLVESFEAFSVFLPELWKLRLTPVNRKRKRPY